MGRSRKKRERPNQQRNSKYIRHITHKNLDSQFSIRKRKGEERKQRREKEKSRASLKRMKTKQNKTIQTQDR